MAGATKMHAEPWATVGSGGDHELARRILSHHSRSFSWGARLLPPWCRRDATALYAWCRRCDDAVDGPVDPVAARAAVARLRAELDSVYRGQQQPDPILAGFQAVVRRCGIPRQYADDLIEGMAMDVGPVRYPTIEGLLLYCYRVAGVVGIMMAYIMKVTDAAALRRATDLGIAMQLTNICRDVAEDARRDRVYVPQTYLVMGDERPPAHAIAELLRRADEFYASGDRGMAALPFRCAVAIRAARLIYAEIGNEIRRRQFDVVSGRVFVSWRRKLWLAARAVVGTGPLRWLQAKKGRWAEASGTSGQLAGDAAPPLPFSLVFLGEPGDHGRASSSAGSSS